MASAQDGDRAAYRRLLTEVADLVRRQARRDGIDGPACEELACNVLRTLHRLRHAYEPSRPFMPWLLAPLYWLGRTDLLLPWSQDLSIAGREHPKPFVSENAAQ